MQRDDLEDILAHAKRKNAAKGITRALVYVDGIFLQILVGDRTQVQEPMVEILQDLRHETAIVLREFEIACAVFGRWQMAYVSATSEQVAAWTGFNVAAGTHEAVNGGGQDPYRAEQFAQSILSLKSVSRNFPTNVVQSCQPGKVLWHEDRRA